MNLDSTRDRTIFHSVIAKFWPTQVHNPVPKGTNRFGFLHAEEMPFANLSGWNSWALSTSWLDPDATARRRARHWRLLELQSPQTSFPRTFLLSRMVQENIGAKFRKSPYLTISFCVAYPYSALDVQGSVPPRHARTPATQDGMLKVLQRSSSSGSSFMSRKDHGLAIIYGDAGSTAEIVTKACKKLCPLASQSSSISFRIDRSTSLSVLQMSRVIFVRMCLTPWKTKNSLLLAQRILKH